MEWWKVLLGMAVPLVHNAGEQYIAQDNNNIGKDDLIGFALEYLADLGTAILSGDTNKIQKQLNKTSPI